MYNLDECGEVYSHDVSQEPFHGLQFGVQAIAEATVQGNTVEIENRGKFNLNGKAKNTLIHIDKLFKFTDPTSIFQKSLSTLKRHF